MITDDVMKELVFVETKVFEMMMLKMMLVTLEMMLLMDLVNEEELLPRIQSLHVLH